MKTHIIRCESFDNLVSLLDRLKWVKTGRVLLVLPVKNPPSLTRLDLVILARNARTLNCELGVVTGVSSIKRAAQQAGLTVFANTVEARTDDRKTNQPQSQLPLRHPVIAQQRVVKRSQTIILPDWLRWLTFGLAVVAVIALLAAFLPAARVELNLPRTNQTASLVMPASLEISKPDLIAGIPLYRVSADVNGMIDQQTTGSVQVADQPAKGMVLFTNLTDKDMNIPVGSITRAVQPMSLRFNVTQAGSLLPGPGTTVSLPVVEMDHHGVAGNLPAGTILAMDGPLGYDIAVTNPQPLSGGTMENSPAVAQADLQAAAIQMEKVLVQRFEEQVRSIIPEDGVLIVNSIVTDKILSKSELPAENKPDRLISLEQQAELSGLYYLGADLKQWTAMAMDTSLAPGQAALSDTLQVETKTISFNAGGTTLVNIEADRQTIPVVDPPDTAIVLRGMKPEPALKLIGSQLFPGSQPVITLFPTWWKWLPIIPMRITVYG